MHQTIPLHLQNGRKMGGRWAGVEKGRGFLAGVRCLCTISFTCAQKGGVHPFPLHHSSGGAPLLGGGLRIGAPLGVGVQESLQMGADPRNAPIPAKEVCTIFLALAKGSLVHKVLLLGR